MTKYEHFKDDFLCWLNKNFPDRYAPVRVPQLADKHGVPEDHVEEMLRGWANEELISLAAYDGERERPWNEWHSLRDFFYNKTDAGHVRVRMLAAGGHYVESLSDHSTPENTPGPAKIGFTAR